MDVEVERPAISPVAVKLPKLVDVLADNPAIAEAPPATRVVSRMGRKKVFCRSGLMPGPGTLTTGRPTGTGGPASEISQPPYPNWFPDTLLSVPLNVPVAPPGLFT